MRIFSGIQPTGKLHIGNYFGAIQNMVKLQRQNEAIFSIVDLHAITVKYEPKELQEKIKDTVLDFLACGIDPEISTVFIQSQIKEHAELANLLQTITPVGNLQRMTQFKDKSQKENSINAGLLMYPVLQAADILLYDTDIVPVGEDQKQHLELVQDIVRRFNNRFGEIFRLPKINLPRNSARIMNLADPSKKMSKSDPTGCVFLSDSPEIIKEKIKKAVTDSLDSIYYEKEKRPGMSNLINIHSSATEIVDVKKLKLEGYNGQHSKYKERVAQSLIKKLEPIRKRRQELEQKPDYIEKVLEQGRERAQKIASQKMEEIKKAMGLV